MYFRRLLRRWNALMYGNHLYFLANTRISANNIYNKLCCLFSNFCIYSRYNFGCIYENLHAHTQIYKGGGREEGERQGGREEERGRGQEKRDCFWKLSSLKGYISYHTKILGNYFRYVNTNVYECNLREKKARSTCEFYLCNKHFHLLIYSSIK